MKKPLVLLVALSFLIFGGACMTPLLYENPTEEKRSFTEDVSTFLITKDGKQLIVIGKKHHYIFAVNETLKFILNWSEKKHVKASFGHFYIKNDQSLSGSYTLIVNEAENLTPEKSQLLVTNGFKSSTNKKRLTYRGRLEGTRYLADKFEVPNTLLLNKKYVIKMTEYYTSAAKVAKTILLTPLAVLADGLLVLGIVPIILLADLFD